MDEVLAPVQMLSSIVLMNGCKNKRRKICIGLILTLVIGSVVARQITKPLYAKNGIIIVSVDYAHYNLKIPTIISCLIITNRNVQIVADFLEMVTDLDRTFTTFGFSTDYSSAKKLTRWLVVYTVIKLFLQHIPFIFKSGEIKIVDFLLVYVVVNVPMVFIHVLVTQWITYLTILRLSFGTLKSILRHSRRVQVMGGSRKNLNKIHQLKAMVRSCGVIYNDLFIQGEQINRAFAVQILCLVPTISLAVIFCSFQTCRMFKEEIAFDYGLLIFDALHCLLFLELVIPCVAVREEMSNFGEELRRINVKKIDHVVDNVILQVHYQKIEFSACGVFPLDETLVYSIIGAVTTYLIMLLQFDL